MMLKLRDEEHKHNAPANPPKDYVVSSADHWHTGTVVYLIKDTCIHYCTWQYIVQPNNST